MTEAPAASADLAASVRQKAVAAHDAALKLATADHDTRVAALEDLAKRLHRDAPSLVEANHEDLKDAKQNGLPQALLDRLKLTPDKIVTLADGVEQVAALPDPVNRTLTARTLDDDLELFQITTPIGVLACIFESRPDAAVQIATLAIKSGNAVLLKGGREAERSNRALVATVRDALAEAGLPEDAVQLLQGRAAVAELLKMDDLVDLVIPRGSSAFVRHIMDTSRIPVLGHAEGVCHLFVDKDADLDKALTLALDAKMDYPAACNAAECVVVHADVAEAFVRRLKAAFEEHGVTVRDDIEALGQEFGDLTCAIAVVPSLEDAIRFVNEHGSRHTDAIVTENDKAARTFVTGVDAAGVFVNASTRFADGYRYGLGAEVGISTSKIHARGPVGLEGLVTYKWVVSGAGHTVADYAPGKRFFKHRKLERAKPLFWES